jgi:hypothetical protein
MLAPASHPSSWVDLHRRASDDLAVSDDPLPAELDHIRVMLERTHAVGRRLVGLHVDDARELAIQSHCHFRVVTNPIMTAELDMRRINVRTEDDIVVDFSTG